MNCEKIQTTSNQIPFFRYLDLKILNCDETTLKAEMPFAERLIGNPHLRNIHGGIIASFMEAAASLVIIEKPENGNLKPINLTVNYLRPAKSRAVMCRVKIVRAGRRIGVVEAVVWQDDEEKPVAKGLFHFLLT